LNIFLFLITFLSAFYKLFDELNKNIALEALLQHFSNYFVQHKYFSLINKLSEVLFNLLVKEIILIK
jgi:hypothetical protein